MDQVCRTPSLARTADLVLREITGSGLPNSGGSGLPSLDIWARTRDRLDAKQLAAELGPIAIPVDPLDTTAATEQQAAS